jgi:hypothetical protein
VNCDDVSGKWADPESGGTWTLTQTGDRISGSLTTSKGQCFFGHAVPPAVGAAFGSFLKVKPRLRDAGSVVPQ